MSFQAPIFLAGLVAIPLALAALALARRRPARYVVRFPALPTLQAVMPRTPRWRRAVPTALLCLALAGLVTALARPEATVAVPVEKASVVLVTDESGSMSATDVDPSRLAAAQSAAQTFLERVPDKLLVGFVGFSSQTNAVVEPTLEREPVRTALEALQADGGTATGDALNAALDRLEARRGADGRRAPAAVILLSDGKTTEGSDPLAAAQRAKQLGIPVSTVALGTADATVSGPDGEPTPRPSRRSAASPAARSPRRPRPDSSTASTRSSARRSAPSASSVRSARASRPRGWSCCSRGWERACAGADDCRDVAWPPCTCPRSTGRPRGSTPSR
jgi:Ca-activated chloride channel homolog